VASLPCYLAGLPRDESTRGALQFARILEQLVPEEDNIEKLFEGAIALRDIPSLECAVMNQAALCATDPHSVNLPELPGAQSEAV